MLNGDSNNDAVTVLIYTKGTNAMYFLNAEGKERRRRGYMRALRSSVLGSLQQCVSNPLLSPYTDD